MKNFGIFKTLIFLSALFCSAYSGAQTNPEIIDIAFWKAYAPEGFDSNDNVQIVGTGVFPNSCYRNAGTNVRIDAATNHIYLSPKAYKYSGLCLQVITPFDRVVDLGILKEGKYVLVQEDSQRTIGELNVRKSRHLEPDDTLYAPISQAMILSSVGANKVYLTGEFPLSCMKIHDVRFEIQPEALVILPLAKIDKSIPCVKGKFPFDIVKEVGAMKPGVYLLHVRSMNGKSVNNLFRIR